VAGSENAVEAELPYLAWGGGPDYNEGIHYHLSRGERHEEETCQNLLAFNKEEGRTLRTEKEFYHCDQPRCLHPMGKGGGDVNVGIKFEA